MSKFTGIISVFLALVAASTAQTLELANGKRVPVRILRAEPAGPQVEFQGATRIIPWAEIRAIHWPVIPEEQAAIAAAAQGAPLVKIIDLWNAKKPWLGRAQSNAGELALALANQLAKRTLPEERARARELFSTVAEGDWSTERKGAALLGRMQLDLAEGKHAAVATEVQALPETASPALAIGARHQLAYGLMQALRALEKEHPKWREEDEVVPQRMALFHATVDHLLYPVLFHGAEEAHCHRHLTALVKFYEEHKETALAAAVRSDLERLYPAGGK